MNTEVYLLCLQCKKITLGTGSGDSRDIIVCNECGKQFTACCYDGNTFQTEGGIFKHNDKRLYLPEDLKFVGR